MYLKIDVKKFFDKEITDSERTLYAYLVYRANFFESKGKDYYESIQAMEEFLGWSNSRVRRAIAGLKKRGWIEVEYREGSTNIYRIVS